MVYKLYLYKSSAYSEGALAIDNVNRALVSYKKEDWRDAERFMQQFDYSIMLAEMDNTIACNGDGSRKYKVYKHYSPTEHIEYLSVCTSFEKVMEIVDGIRGLATKYLITIYDPYLKKYYFPNEPQREQYVELKKREKELLKVIRDVESPYSIIKLEDWPSAYDSQVSYAITISKNGDTFEDRVSKFANLLSSNIKDGERFYCMDDCFHVSAERYRITFVYEGYKKTADRIGYMNDDNQPCSKLIYRMSSLIAWKQVPSLGYKDNYEFIYRSMRMEELVYKYPNPAERLVFICKFQKRLKKFDGYADYDPYHWYGGDVRMNKFYADGFSDNVCCSYLKIEEDFAMIFTPCVEKYYPYFNQRYYLTDNYLPDVMCWKILEEAKRVRHMLANNPYSAESQKYLSEGRCEWLLKDEKDFWKAIGLMDVFIEWLELQFEDEDDYSRDFFIDITGP